MHVNMNIIKPLPVSCDASYLLAVVDRLTSTAKECPYAFCLSCVTQFDVPLHQTLDWGQQFVFSMWTQTLIMNLHMMMAYYSQANGLVKQFHQTLRLLCAHPCLGLTDLMTFVGYFFPFECLLRMTPVTLLQLLCFFITSSYLKLWFLRLLQLYPASLVFHVTIVLQETSFLVPFP